MRSTEAENAEDLEAFEATQHEPNLRFHEVLQKINWLDERAIKLPPQPGGEVEN